MQKKALVLLFGLGLIALGLLTGCPRRPQIKEAVPGAIGPAVPPRAVTAAPQAPKPLVPPKEVQEAKVPSAEGPEPGGEAAPEVAAIPKEEGILGVKEEPLRRPSGEAREVSPPPPVVREGSPSAPPTKAPEAAPRVEPKVEGEKALPPPPVVREGSPSAPPTKAPEAAPRVEPKVEEGEVRTPGAIVIRPIEEQRPEEQPGIREETVPTFPRAREESLPLGTPQIVEQELKGPAKGPEVQIPEAAPPRPVEEARREREPRLGEESPPVGTPEARVEGLKAPVTEPGLAREEGKVPEVSAPAPEGVPGPSPLTEEAFPFPSVTGKEEKEILPEAPSEVTAIAKAPEGPSAEEGGTPPAPESPVEKPLESPGVAGGQEGLQPVPSGEMTGGPEPTPSSGEEAPMPPPVTTEPRAPETPQALARAVETPGAGQLPSPPAGRYPEFAPPVYAPEIPQVPEPKVQEPVLKAEAQVLLPEAPLAATAPPPVGPHERPLQDIFFDFNESLIREADRATLEQNAAWLRAHPSVKILIEGHCDERGTNEYNLALGERRARATKEYLSAAGIDPDRIKTVSYGEERPFVLGHDEEAWRWNRRAHFVLLAP